MVVLCISTMVPGVYGRQSVVNENGIMGEILSDTEPHNMGYDRRCAQNGNNYVTEKCILHCLEMSYCVTAEML